MSNVDDADHLSDLPWNARMRFLADMARLGEAVATACRAADPAFLRINYEILGNTLHHLHAHLFARYGWEPEQRRKSPVWLYGEDVRQAPEHRLGPAHDELRDAIRTALQDRAAGAPVAPSTGP